MNDTELSYQDVPLSIEEEENGCLTFTWDENHPVTSILNNWTEDDFIKMVIKISNQLAEKHGK